jgi:hypothetical protein
MNRAAACFAGALLTIGVRGASARPTEEVFAQYKNRVVQVRVLENTSSAKAALGSGFFVAPGKLVTNYHVISQMIWRPEHYHAVAALVDGSTRPLSLLNVDVVHDLALLALDGAPRVPSLPVETSLPPKGARLYALGNPHDLGMTIVEGTFSGLIEESLYQKLHFTGSVNPGMSGGPVLDRAGRVVGVTVATAGEQVGFLVPGRYTAELLRSTATMTGANVLSIVSRQLLANQDAYMTALTSTPFVTTEVGPFRLAGRLSPAFHLWARNEDEEKQPYQLIHAQANTQDEIFLKDGLGAGEISLTHHAFWSDTLNPFQFSALRNNRWTGEGGALRRLFSGSDEDFSPMVCESSLVAAGGGPLKGTFCLRAYVKLPGLYDVEWRGASLREDRRAFTTRVSLTGVSVENAKAFLRRTLEAVQWPK